MGRYSKSSPKKEMQQLPAYRRYSIEKERGLRLPKKKAQQGKSLIFAEVPRKESSCYWSNKLFFTLSIGEASQP
jgi:hypothetical protein